MWEGYNVQDSVNIHKIYIDINWPKTWLFYFTRWQHCLFSICIYIEYLIYYEKVDAIKPDLIFIQSLSDSKIWELPIIGFLETSVGGL